MSNIFVQGASRGLGFAFVKSFLRNPKNVVFASARTANVQNGSGESLIDLKTEFPNLELITMDVINENDIMNAADIVKNSTGKLELLLNCSAMLHPTGKGETKLADVKPDFLYDTFSVNTFGPLLMAKHFGKLLQKGNGTIGSQAFKDDKNLNHCGVIANLSARIGSIDDNKLGGWYAYRMSKTALNMANKYMFLFFCFFFYSFFRHEKCVLLSLYNKWNINFCRL